MPRRLRTKTRKSRKVRKSQKKRTYRKSHKKVGGDVEKPNPPNLLQAPVMAAAIEAANANLVSGLTEEEWLLMEELRDYFLEQISPELREMVLDLLGRRAYELSVEGDTNGELEEGELPNVDDEDLIQRVNQFLELLRKHNPQDLQQTIAQFHLEV